MKYINTIKEGDKLSETYLCKYKQLLSNRHGKSYYSLKLQDKTGIIDAKVWDINKNIEQFEVFDYISIKGNVIIYQDNYQLNVRKITKANKDEVNPANYIPSTKKDIEGLLEQLSGVVTEVDNKYIKALLESFFSDQEFIKSFKHHSAAKSVHHAYLGGLLEHTLAVCEIGKGLCNQYPLANKDLVIAGCLLHDIGKLYELSGFPENNYTDVGSMLGHITISVEMIHDNIKEISGFPKDLALLIKHIIVSHHGEYEYGSPKRPKTIEAIIVHCADNTDSKVKMIEEDLLNDTSDDLYAGYNRILNRSIRKSVF